MIAEKIKEFEQMTKEDRVERLEITREEQAKELKAVELTIDKVSELNKIVPSNSEVRDELKRFVNKLIVEKDFQEKQLKEIDASIDYVKSESKDIKSII